MNFVSNIIWNSVEGFVEAGTRTAGQYAGDALIKAGDMIENSGRKVGTGIERTASGYGSKITGQSYQPSGKALPSTARRPAIGRSNSSPASTTAMKKVGPTSKTPIGAKKPGAAQKAIGGAAGGVNKSISGVSGGVNKTVGGVGGGANTAIGGVGASGQKMIGGVSGSAQKTLGGVSGQAQKSVGGVLPGAGKAIGGVSGTAQKSINGITGGAQKTLGGVTGNAQKTLGGVTGGAQKSLGGVTNGASKGLQLGSVTKAPQKAMSTAGSVKPYSPNSYPTEKKTAVKPGQYKPFSPSGSGYNAGKKDEGEQKMYPGTSTPVGGGKKTPVKKYKPIPRMQGTAEKGKMQHITV